MMGEEGLLVPLRQAEPLAPDVSDEVCGELVQFFTSGEPAQQITDLLARDKGPSRCAKAELVVEALDLFEQVPGERSERRSRAGCKSPGSRQALEPGLNASCTSGACVARFDLV